MKVMLLTGNGFNYLIRDIIKNIPNEDIPKNLHIPINDIVKGINDITAYGKNLMSYLKIFAKSQIID